MDRCRHALTMALEKIPKISNLVLAGGVAANQYFRERLRACAQERGLSLITPPVHLCTDNGAMIAWAGVEHLRRRFVGSLSFAPRPRWPLEDLKAEIKENFS